MKVAGSSGRAIFWSIDTTSSRRSRRSMRADVLALLSVVAGLPSCNGDTTSEPPAPRAARLAFVVEPSRTEAGVAITPAPRVAIQDQFGNMHTTGTIAVTVTLG